jgi:hypothetical protein
MRGDHNTPPCLALLLQGYIQAPQAFLCHALQACGFCIPAQIINDERRQVDGSSSDCCHTAATVTAAAAAAAATAATAAAATAADAGAVAQARHINPQSF